MKSPEPPKRPQTRRLGPIALLALALGTQPGCQREFYREWANQDVSEAVFEKSRDPRIRMDMFSIDPPALARYADPYDPDVPPAPPDDRATQALSPTPQWPDNRLITPVEGTGYLDMLEAWRREDPTKKSPARAPTTEPSMTLPPPTPPMPPAGAESPFRSPANSGTNPRGTSPTSLPGRMPPEPNPPGSGVG